MRHHSSAGKSRIAEFCVPQDRLRAFVARALWDVFPSRSEHELCLVAAPVLGKSGETIRRLLRREQDVKLADIWPILAMLAAIRGVNLLDLLFGEGDE